MTAEALAPGTVCPYCRSGFEPDEEITHCPACGTPHHADCFAENGGCTIFGCTAAPVDDPKISITPTDLHPPAPSALVAPVGGSIYHLSGNLGGAQQSAPPQSTPPPPLPAGTSAPPPPRAANLAFQPFQPGYGASTALAYYDQAYSNYYVRPKSRVVFVLLAIFLGAFGAHNFYTGYNKKAVIQLCISVCTCFYASPISWIWAIVEACTVTMDDDGVLLN